MTEAEKLPPPLPPRLAWFVHTQMGLLAQGGVPEWFHGTISREAAEDLLESEPPGSFLIRVSHSHVGYTLSYKAPNCCRHFMVKVLDDGSLVIPGEKVVHASLDDLVTFHRQKPVWPHEELLTQACGQKDPANVDYEDLFLYSNALAEEAASLAHDLREHQRPFSCPVAAPGAVPLKPVPLCQSEERKLPAEPERESTQGAASSCPPKAPFRETRRKLWKTLKGLPQAGRQVQLQLQSHLAAVSLSSLWGAGRSPGTPDSGVPTDNRRHWGEAAWKDSVSRDPGVATSFDPSQPQARRNRDTSSRKAARPMSWSGVTPGVRGWHQKVVRALSSQEAKPEPMDVAETELDWLPEEYLPPPPFAPGYC